MTKTNRKIIRDIAMNNCSIHYDKIIRNEWAILTDFKILGWHIMRNTPYVLELVQDNFIIEIDKTLRAYSCHCTNGKDAYITFFDMIEHKLLHELFECWGWL